MQNLASLDGALSDRGIVPVEILVPLSIPDAATASAVGQMAVAMAVVADVGGVAADPDPADLVQALRQRAGHDELTFKVYIDMAISPAAVESARPLGYSLEDIVEAVQELGSGDLIKSETAHNPPNSKVWHDTYNIPWDGR